MVRKRECGWLLGVVCLLAACGDGRKGPPLLQDGSVLPPERDSGGPGSDAGPGPGDAGVDSSTPLGTGSVTGFIFDHTAAPRPLEGVTIRGPEGKQTQSDAQGAFTLSGLTEGDALIHADPEGYGSTLRVVRVLKDASSYLELSVREAYKQTLDASKGGRAKDKASGAAAKFAAGSLQTKEGGAASGKVSVSMVALADDPKAKSGPKDAKDQAATKQGSLKGTALMEVHVTDEAGNKLQLANEKEAELEIPVSAKASAPAKQIDLWSLDEATGIWKKEGQATKAQNVEGKSVYKAKIKHMSFWSADTLLDEGAQTCVRGCVVQGDEAKTPAIGANVLLTGDDSPYASELNTDATGCFHVNLEANLKFSVRAGTVEGAAQARQHTSGASPKRWQAAPEACDDLGQFVLAARPVGERCPTGYALCDGECIDLQNDSQHCGSSCNEAVACNEYNYNDEEIPAKQCVAGSCQCSPGWTLCGDRCVDLANDARHCGKSCSAFAICDLDTETCDEGACVPLTCTDAAESACPAYGPDERVVCTDGTSDLQHCGGCNIRCNYQGEGGEEIDPNKLCVEGQCDCGPGYAKCPPDAQDGDYNCVDVQTDAYNCGGCSQGNEDAICALEQSCVAGSCTALACSDGLTACYHACVDLQTDEGYCGSCGNSCDGASECVGGECVPMVCEAGGVACEGSCQYDNIDHCGECDSMCDGGQICSGGSCECEDGLTDCEGSCRDLQTDPNSCGACFEDCEAGFTCAGGSCVEVDCGDDTLCNDRDCVDVDSNEDHCGGCNARCDTFWNGEGSCVAGVCYCPTGWTTCVGPYGTACAAPMELCPAIQAE
jgi:hypothetical protein